MKKDFMIKSERIMKSGYMTKSGFTLVELMVSITILALILVMLSGMVNYTSGRLKSAQLKLVNDSLRQSLDLISQKMYNANAHTVITQSGNSIDIFGFRYYDSNHMPDSSSDNPSAPDMLVIVSSDLTGGQKTCTYFGKKDNQLFMDQDSGCTKDFQTPSQLVHAITPSKISIQNFKIDSSSSKMMTNTSVDFIPHIEITIDGYNLTDPQKSPAQVQTTLTMDGENVRSLQ
jgi:prepilin-type N-terminal cleavage/methylation domain-containing protein